MTKRILVYFGLGIIALAGILYFVPVANTEIFQPIRLKLFGPQNYQDCIRAGGKVIPRESFAFPSPLPSCELNGKIFENQLVAY